MPPSEFWQITPIEFWWRVEARNGQRKQEMRGGMSEALAEELYQMGAEQ